MQPECCEFRTLPGREDRVNLRVRGIDLLTHLRTDITHGCIDLRPVTFDDLLHLRLLLWCELELAGKPVCHPIRSEARRVTRKQTPASDQVQMITSHANKNAGEEGGDHDHDGRGSGITRH